MSKPVVPKRLKKLVKAAEQQGWTFGVSAKQHPRLMPPAGLRDANGNLVAPVTFASTPSDHRSDKNAIATLRRAGVRV